MNTALLLAGVLLLLGIASSKFLARLGVPVLVLFLSVGMLAGSEGLGRIPFGYYPLANDVGSVALAFILFDGGLRTSLASDVNGHQMPEKDAVDSSRALSQLLAGRRKFCELAAMGRNALKSVR